MNNTSIATQMIAAIILVMARTPISQADEGTDGIRTELKADDLVISFLG